MLGFFREKSAHQNSLFWMTVQVGRGSNVDMPSNMVGAFVPVFAPGENHELAAQSAVLSLVSQGFEFLDIAGQISKLDPMQWNDFIKNTWPEFLSHFPDQREALAKIQAGEVFYGPFAGYDAHD